MPGYVRTARWPAAISSQDKLGNFEIQDLMSRYNQAETLTSNVLRKRDQTNSAIVGRI